MSNPIATVRRCPSCVHTLRERKPYGAECGYSVPRSAVAVAPHHLGYRLSEIIVCHCRHAAHAEPVEARS